jgi:hypothetical protein
VPASSLVPPIYSPLPSDLLFLSLSLTRLSSRRSLNMKDLSSSSKHNRNSLIYPRKRPSPHGITKARKSPLLPSQAGVRKTPRSAKTALVLQQQQREARIIALRKDGILLEEEYRDEIRQYMHDMEVSGTFPCFVISLHHDCFF